MLGGGVFVTQNKVFPGAYMNFVSADRASSTFSERGVAALPMKLDWGVEGEVITLQFEDFVRRSSSIFGYDYSDDAMVGLREVFKNATKVLVYRLNGGAKATCAYAEARFTGSRGNDLSVVIEAVESQFKVKTLLNLRVVDEQVVKSSTDELVDNDFVVWKGGVALQATAKTPLTGGSTVEADVDGWQSALNALESYSFNTLGVATDDDDIKLLAVDWTKVMRDTVGVKFQTVVFNYTADHESIINLVSSPAEQDSATAGLAKVGKAKIGSSDVAALVYWVTGDQAGCAVNASCTNNVYNGEFNVNVKRTQSELEDCIRKGQFVFHKVGDDVRVLTDINSLTSSTQDKGEDFKSNQTVRVIDQIGNDVAVIFNTQFLGIVPNDESGRISLWNAIVNHHEKLNQVRAIENFTSEDVVVMKGDTKKSVVVSDKIQVVNALEQLYMTVTVA